MESAKTLLRTTVRTFFTNPKQILIIDALLLHSVLHIDDLAILLSSQAKDIRALINPLRSARLLSTHSRLEVRVGSNRGSPREYYYIPLHPAIDAIKYRVAKLRRKVESLYQQDETKRKDWRCPRCKAEYEQLEILDRMSDDGFYCERCGETLIQNEAAAQDRGNHEKIRRLNTQLAKFDEMLSRVDRVEIPTNDFTDAWERKREVPREKGTGYAGKIEYVELKREDKNGARSMQKKQEIVDSKNLNINLLSGAEREKEMEEEKERRRQELAKQNSMPVWHSKSAIGLAAANDAAVKAEEGGTKAGVEELLKREEQTEEKKINVEDNSMQDEVAAYMAEMERERLERERKEQEASDEEDEDEGDFEDVDVAGTPMSSQQSTSKSALKTENGSSNKTGINGLKREFDPDGGSSGISSDANTPASFAGGDRDSKRVKFENGITSAVAKVNGVENGSAMKQEEEADSEEDEDFEDAM